MEVEILVKKFRHHFSLAALLMVVVLLAGCIGGETAKEEYTLNITVKLAEGGEGKVEDVALKVGDKAVDVDADGKATASATEGDVVVEAVLEGYVTYKETITVTKNAELTITLEIEEEPATEEELVAAVVEASEGEDAEAFLEALQALEEAGFVTGVEEDFAGLYLKQAKDYESLVFVAEAVPPFMRNAGEIQNNVINPVNEAVADAIKAVNTAVSTAELSDALDHLMTNLGLLKGVEESNVDVYAALLKKYPSSTVTELQAIIKAAADMAAAETTVDGLFGTLGADEKPTLAENVTQKKIDDAKKLVDELTLVTDTKDGTKKTELLARIAVAQELYHEDTFVAAKEAIEVLFVENADEPTLEANVDKDAIDAAEKKLDLYKGTKSTDELRAKIAKARELLALREEAALVDAVKEATDEFTMQTALEAVNFARYNNLKADNRAEVAELLFNSKPEDGFGFKTIADVTDALDTLIDKYEGQIAAVNAATDNTTMLGVLQEIFEDDGVELANAENVLKNKPEKGYTTLAAIKEAFD
jgi:hypothetical protein